MIGLSVEDILTITVAVLGSGGIGATAIKAFRDWRSGKVESERSFHQRMIREARENDLRADMEVRNRIAWMEYSSILRRMLIELGLDSRDLPKEPVNEKCPLKGE